MFDIATSPYSEFLRPLVTGWIAKIEAATRARKAWKEIADECHDEQTEVLTSAGWMLFSDLTGDELLGTVNLETDTIEFQKPTRLTRHHRVGDMIRFKGKSLDALVTPGHRMVAFPPHSGEPGFKEAGSLLRSDQLKLTADNWAGVAPVLPDFLRGIDQTAFAEWLGFYIAEGWCDKDKPEAVVASYRVGVAQKKPAGRRYYENLAKRVGLRAPPYSKRGNTYQFTSKELCLYLRQFGDCYTKHVPQWVKDAPPGVIAAFLRGYIAGDGHTAKSGQVVSATASRRLADDIQELWLKVGRSASIKERQPSPYRITDPGREARTGMSGKLYLVTAWSAGKRASLKRHVDGEIRLKYHTEHYDGMVYCATVPNSTLITRRNGLPLISGNCVMFYSKSAAAMYDPMYSRKFWTGMAAPKFRITINKAFELVAVFGPNLLWDTPHRQAEPKKQLAIPQELLSIDPQLQQMLPMLEQELARERGRDKLTAHLMQLWLNYTPKEMPGGGLEGHSELAVIDALLKGRGCLWIEPYSFPSSGRTLTGAFRSPPEDLLIDPDFNSLDEAKWIARKHTEPHWAVERRFKLPPNALRGKATLESSWNYGELQATEDKGNPHRATGQTNDLVVWYEIFSKTGPGARMTNMPDAIKAHLEETVGDYAYIAVCAECPFPLNCPTQKLREGMSTKQVQHEFSWPVPLWTDDRWPVETLDFYPNTDSAWPVPPLAPGMGELKFLNVLIPWLANRIYSNSRDIFAVLGPQVEHYKQYLESSLAQVVMPVAPGGPSSDDIRKVIQVLQMPETKADDWRIVELVSELFDKRTGLTEFAYGRNEGGTQNRTAEETIAKQRAVGVRPEHMQKKVVAWQSRVASVEAMLAYMFVKSRDVEPLLGRVGAMLWQRYIENADGELIVRQMQYTVAASSIRRPNRDRDVANFQQFCEKFLPLIQARGTQTGDYSQANWVVGKFGEFHDMDVSGAMFPPPDPEAEQIQQQQGQLALDQMAAETEKMRAEAQKATAEAQANPAELKMVELAMEQQGEEQRLAIEIQKMQAELAMKKEELRMKMQAEAAKLAMKAQEHQQEMQFRREEGQVDLAVKQATGAQQIAMGRQQMQMQEQQHRQQMAQGAQSHRQSLTQTKQTSQAKVQAIKAQAKAKPKPTNGAACK